MAGYLMEHPLEAERLELKTRKEKILEELKHLPLRPGMDVLDVGCGTGAVTRILAGIVSPGRVLGIDFSRERLSVARRIAEEEGISNVRYIQTDVRGPGLAGSGFDLVFSRCLFQYLPGQAGMETLQSMKRLTRPGGWVSVADIDGNLLYRYPLDNDWSRTLDHLVDEVERTGFDAFVGRKLFWMFRQAGLRDIRVDILPYYLIAGRADQVTVRTWQMKAQILSERLVAIFGSADKAKEVADRFVKDLLDDDTLLYNLLFLVQGKA